MKKTGLFDKFLYHYYYSFYLKWKIQFLQKMKMERILRKANKVGICLRANGTVEGISKNITIKDYVNFNGVKFLGKGKVTIGNYFHSGEQITFLTSNHNFRNAFAIPYDNTYKIGDIVVDDFVWLGHGVIILPGVTLGEGCIVGAGAVVTKDVEPLSIVAGNPAKKIGKRDPEEFYRLKKEGKFH
jgi:acetyltransferase-like isoleucine patch superfamily enzyme